MLLIKPEYLNAVGQYLATKPYKEVHNLLAMLHTAQPIEAKKEAPKPEKEDAVQKPDAKKVDVQEQAKNG